MGGGKRTMRLCSLDLCTGCGACRAVCPTHSIRMSRDCFIHDYPVINNNTCINCGKCSKVCPSLNLTDGIINYEQQFYYCWNLDDVDRAESTSGGFASALSKHAIKLGYKVCGVCYDENWKVVHRVVEKEEDTLIFKGSKYVQSDSSDALSKIRTLLKNGEKVLFIGTPCQAEGLRSIVNDNENDNLLTCEIICHGVNSPRVWEEYVEYIEHKYESNLNYFNFRCKERGWQKKNGGGNLQICYKTKSGKTINQPFWRNDFAMWFAKHYILRPSCISCQYRKESRRSDLTIGDFWNIETIVPEINQEELFKGVSVVISSTPKGLNFLKLINNIRIAKVDSNEAKKVLKGFIEKKSDAERKLELQRMRAFEKEYIEKGIAEMIKLYPHVSYWRRIIDGIRNKLHLK